MRRTTPATMALAVLTLSPAALAEDLRHNDDLYFRTSPGLLMGGRVDDFQADSAGFGFVWDLSVGYHVHRMVALHGTFVAQRVYLFPENVSDAPPNSSGVQRGSETSVDVIPVYAGGVGATVVLHPRVSLSFDALVGSVSAGNRDEDLGVGFRLGVFSPLWDLSERWSLGPGGGTSVLVTDTDSPVRFFNSFEGFAVLSYR